MADLLSKKTAPTFKSDEGKPKSPNKVKQPPTVKHIPKKKTGDGNNLQIENLLEEFEEAPEADATEALA